MAKAVFIDKQGGPEALVLRDYDPGPPGAGELRVRNTAIGLNFIDIYVRKGLYPLPTPPIPGAEAAGVVEALGPGVTGFAVGDRVAWTGPGGAYADYAHVPAGMAAHIPSGVSDEVAAGSFLKGLTVDMLVREVHALKTGEACLVTAAAGGVGTLLCQWAASIGARVIAVVGSEEKAAHARENGAADVIVRTKNNSYAPEVRRLTDDQGVCVVYDSVGAATFHESLDCLAIRGHMISYGNASGPAPSIAPLELTRRGSITLSRPSLFHYATPGRLPAMAAALFSMIEARALRPHVGRRFALADIAEAHRFLESGKSQGAIILEP